MTPQPPPLRSAAAVIIAITVLVHAQSWRCFEDKRGRETGGARVLSAVTSGVWLYVAQQRGMQQVCARLTSTEAARQGSAVLMNVAAVCAGTIECSGTLGPCCRSLCAAQLLRPSANDTSPHAHSSFAPFLPLLAPFAVTPTPATPPSVCRTLAPPSFPPLLLLAHVTVARPHYPSFPYRFPRFAFPPHHTRFPRLRPVAMVRWEAPMNKPLYTCVSSAVARAIHDMRHPVGITPGRDLQHIPVDYWRQDELQALQVGQQSGSLLLADAAAYGTVVAPSTVHGRGVFATRRLRKGQRILPFFGQLVYDDLELAALSSSGEERSQTYGNDLMPPHLRCTAWEWLSTSMEVRMHKRFWKGTEDCSRMSWVPAIGTKACVSRTRPSARPVWVVPAAFCAARFVNDPRPYQTANVQFEQLFDPVYSSTQLLAPGVVRMVVLRRIRVGEELFVDYGNFYSTFGV